MNCIIFLHLQLIGTNYVMFAENHLIMKKHLLITLAIFFLSLTSAQGQFVNYENDHGWNLGFNIGGVWQQNDFDYTPKGGISGGLTFGKSIYEKEGAFFAFDLRYRYLGGWNKGYATDTSTIYLDTASFLGYQNYRLALHEHTLEGVLTLNRLRESTGILLYGFGGIGLTNYSVKANYEDGIFGDYDYSSIDNSQSPNEIVDDLDRMLDNSYETTIKERGTDFMPSLGFGIGYQFPYHFSMGLEHKITYALADEKLNGIPNLVNDRYHYSALYFRWNLFGSGNQNYTVNNSGSVNNYTTVTPPPVVNTPAGNKPLVNITNPSANNTTVQNSAQTISANIYYVETKDKVIFKQNGIQLSNFNYNSNTNHFDASVILQPGNNVFEISGSNAYGSDQDSKIIILQKPVEVTPPPIVTITNPPYCPFIVESAQFILTSTVLNIDNANQITFKFNGINSANFSYNISTKVFSSGLTLKEGNNTIQITATNSQGSVTKTCTIAYTAVNALPPIVDITFPALNPYNTTASLVNINGTVKNVTLKSQIKVYVNGSIQQNFAYNSGTKQVSFPANLILGSNVIQISASNSDGYDAESTTIIYAQPETLPPPVVAFVSPAVSPHTIAISNMNIKATVLNVNGKPGISVKHNGVAVTNFSFSPITKLVSFNTNLVIGSNLFEVKGTNAVGSDTKVARVIYKKPSEINPPVVTITKPSVTPYMVNFPAQAITANILNVNNANNVTAIYNGVAISNFVYDPATTEFSYSANLLEGANTLSIAATNVAGTASKTQTVIYVTPPCEKPTLTQIAPTANPHATSNSKGYLEYGITNATSVVFNINGQSSLGFDFNQATGKFTSMLHLTEGATSYEVIATNSCGSTSQMTAIIYEEELPCYEPTISFINPSTSPFEHIGKTGNTSFTANIGNVSNQNMILVTLNGTAISLSYNALSGNISGAISLIEGSNTISISATNECGNTTSETIITYEGIQNQLPPPVVTITAPNANPYSTTNSNETITATVLNVTGVNDISAIFNGTPITNFNYNSTNKVFSYNAPLINGLNSLIISGTNTVGTDLKTQTITKSEPCVDPTISFSEPTASANGYTSFFAIVANITNSNLIVVSHNGSSVPYTHDAGTGKVSVTLMLIEGNNLIGVSASNACGSALSEHNIMYTAPVEAPCVNPLITISSPPMSNSPQYTFTAAVSNVLSASNVNITLNGVGVSSSFDVGNGSLSAPLTLIVGDNTIVVNANECDGATESIIVNYTVHTIPFDTTETLPGGPPRCENPIINLSSGLTSSTAAYNLTGNISNVTNGNNVSVTLNGINTSSNFNLNSEILTASLALNEGSNTIVVVANECDGASETLTVMYTVPCAPVAYSLVVPNSTSTISATADYVIKVSAVNVLASSNITTTLNGASVPFTFDANSGMINCSNITLEEGDNPVVVTIGNSCSDETIYYTITYEAPVVLEPTSCGPRFNPGNADWQFCLVTPSGTYNREDLASNSNFSYSGPATSVYFKPIAGGGDAIVNGQPYSVQNGQYYLFQGGLTVDVSSSHPGSMGHWEICVTSNSIPVFGNGNNRPVSPCEDKSGAVGGSEAEAEALKKAKTEAANAKAAADNKAKTDAAYNSAIQKGDMYYNSKKWSSAKQYYNQASTLKPNENYPKDKIVELENVLKTDAQKKADAKAKADAAAKAKADAAAKAKADAAAKTKADAAAKTKADAAAKTKADAAAKTKADAAAKTKADAAAKAKAAAAAKAKAAAAAKAKADAAAKTKAAAAAKTKADAAAKVKADAAAKTKADAAAKTKADAAAKAKADAAAKTKADAAAKAKGGGK